jgi:hypothetical protein
MLGHLEFIQNGKGYTQALQETPLWEFDPFSQILDNHENMSIMASSFNHFAKYSMHKK